jgi:hypothetical protein
MTTLATDDDHTAALPNQLLIATTDVEISTARSGDDLIVWINKGGILILRVRLQNAAREISAEQLLAFSTVAPDFVFKIGDTAEGLARLRRSLGIV